MSVVFDCQQCGQCCEGRGGIVLSAKDIIRLAVFLESELDEVRQKYCEISNGKLKIRTGIDGFCIFFKKGQGCAIHEGKPDICRAWPFFRGNLVDAHSFYMAREFCPGIARDISYEIFVTAGKEYLSRNGLLVEDATEGANALIINNINICTESKDSHELGI